MSKCALTTGRDIHSYKTRDRDNYRTGRHSAAIYPNMMGRSWSPCPDCKISPMQISMPSRRWHRNLFFR
ncbi:hypothetical protein J6590_048074 [Homalodisca vitripennis]|nr:hypothetical protein J6590_048074 [Homalodisca vitripennis]